MSDITLPREVALQIREALMVAVTLSADRHTVKAAFTALDAALAEPEREQAVELTRAYQEGYEHGTRNARQEPEPDAIAAQYNELLMAVAQKHPNETRHETALRYITQAERQSTAPDQAWEDKT